VIALVDATALRAFVDRGSGFRFLSLGMMSIATSSNTFHTQTWPRLRRVGFVTMLLLVMLVFLNVVGISYSLTRQPTNLLVLGLGRVGLAVTNKALEKGCFDTMTGTVRETVSHDEQSDKVLRRVSFQDTDSILRAARQCTHLFVTIPPMADSEKNDQTVSVFRSVVKAFPKASWIGVLSTTGVYGNHNGAWVTEESACLSESSTSSRYLAYEDAWKERAQQYHHDLCIFRCSGIYGSQQSALHTVFKKGIVKKSQEPAPASESLNLADSTIASDITNRIHVVDLATAVVASMMARSYNRGCSIYNLSDDLPESRTLVMEHAAELLQSVGAAIPESPAAVPTGSTGSRGRRRGTDQKRVCNRKMKIELLGGILGFPSYVEGLADILQERTNPWWNDKIA